ncbi:DUF3310 domain-containing protein [Virgibacillus salexigens]|uniref:DUF3310 domain-containing protein n=1 Tax=Virgibacillus kapii TaxID=1638645 RepID=A0ABQ2DA20_9BACI|nr:DUF3310 domain-containing protein [Virgibacillus kapii]GGJ48836.1 hypothetical protein GCM10007111_08540 [Virgibacillus kapii]
MENNFYFKTNKLSSNGLDSKYAAREKDGVFDIRNAKTGQILMRYSAEEVAERVGNGDWEIIQTDNVNHPDHYQGKTEVIDIIEQATEGLQGINAVCTGNVIKYVMRFQKKGGVEDLKKAQWYLNKLIGGYENE